MDLGFGPERKMTSLCNYSHPELQITDGLERSGKGTLFPYNPEFYELGSGLYGPGTVLCWYLLLGSVIANWSMSPRPKVTTDLLVLVVYPMFAATDLVVKGMRLLGTDYRGLAIFCLRFPTVYLDSLARYEGPQPKLNLADIPPDDLLFGQRIVAITGPLPICYMFTLVFTPLVVLLLLFCDVDEPGGPTRWTVRVVVGSYCYVCLAEFILVCSLGDFSISMTLPMYEVITPILFFIIHIWGLMMSMGIIAAMGKMVISLWTWNVNEALKFLGMIPVAAVFGVLPWAYVLYKGDLVLMPDVGVSIGESDQLAALLAGIMTPCFTIYHHVFAKGDDDERVDTGEEEEMQSLAADV